MALKSVRTKRAVLPTSRTSSLLKLNRTSLANRTSGYRNTLLFMVSGGLHLVQLMHTMLPEVGVGGGIQV